MTKWKFIYILEVNRKTKHKSSQAKSEQIENLSYQQRRNG